MRFRRRGLWSSFVSLLKVRIVAPMLRSKHPPEFTAKGSLVGMAWAMTPLVGVQMYLVFLTWLGTRKFFKWDFNLPVALAWTWVTNVFTMLPTYYAFYVTGKIMTGTFEKRTTYGAFVRIWKETFRDSGALEALKISYDIMVKDWGMSMMIGALPWAFFCGWGAYAWTLWFLRRREIRKQKKLEKKNNKVQVDAIPSEQDM